MTNDPTTDPADDIPASVSAFLPLPRANDEEFAALPRSLQRKLLAWWLSCGLLDEAARAMDAIEARGGGGVQLLQNRAALALARGDEAGVRSWWAQRLAAGSPPATEAAYARDLAELGALDDAQAIAQRLAVTNPEVFAVQSLQVQLGMLQAGSLVAARLANQAQLVERPDSPAVLFDACRLAILSNDLTDARRILLDLLQRVTVPSESTLFAAASIADIAGLSTLSRSLRHRASSAHVARAAALAAEVDATLGRESGAAADQDPPAPPPSQAIAVAGAPDATVAPAIDARTHEPDNEPGQVADQETEVIAPAADEVPSDPRVQEALSRYWGFDGLRRGQAAVINRMLAGTDTLAIMPTGAGKSLTFQLPSMLLEGITLVISPLIALMKDQVDGLPEEVRQQTALLNSTLSSDEQRAILDGIRARQYRLVYVAPERLRQHAFVRALREAGVARVVVDEAHCISLWGHDFRPDYLAIPAVLPALGDPPVLAITATATREIEQSIAARFGRDLDVLRTGVFRPNLRYEVEHLPTRDARVQRMLDLCREIPGPGIVYVSSRKDAENFADLLRRNGVNAVPYHAGFDSDTRSRHQDQFMENRARVVVATVAFGMGVDKPDVRFIIHASPPGSLEAYAHESGRAGRDGNPSRCIMLSLPTDRTALNRIAKRDALDLDDLRRVYRALQQQASGSWAILDPSSLVTLRDGEDPDDVPDPRIALNLLEEGGLTHRHPDAPVSWNLYPTRGNGGAPSPIWDRLVAWWGLDPARGSAIIRTADACAALDCTPVDLGAAIADAPGWRGNEGPRMACVELLTTTSTGRDSARNRLDAVLFAATRRSQQRIARVIDYQAGQACRHVLLARHLGERLEPCGSACDVCEHTEGEERAAGVPAQRQRAAATATDAAAVLRGAASLHYPLGRARLILFLLGSPESRVRPGQSDWYGALADLRKARIDALITRLLEADLLYIDPEDDYKVIHAAPGAADLGPDDLAQFADPTGAERRAARSSSGGTATGEEAQLDPEAQALFDRLTAWRRERATRDGLPSYTIASNRSLTEMAARRPNSVAALAAIWGFGEGRAAKYGADLLPMLNEEP